MNICPNYMLAKPLIQQCNIKIHTYLGKRVYTTYTKLPYTKTDHLFIKSSIVQTKWQPFSKVPAEFLVGNYCSTLPIIQTAVLPLLFSSIQCESINKKWAQKSMSLIWAQVAIHLTNSQPVSATHIQTVFSHNKICKSNDYALGVGTHRELNF